MALPTAIINIPADQKKANFLTGGAVKKNRVTALLAHLT